jgi:hypothetical protein
MEQKAHYQLSGDEQIVARFMIEQQHFRGIGDAVDAATCLASYDLSRYPENTGKTFTEFFYPRACRPGLLLEQSARHVLEHVCQRACLGPSWPAPAEIPMDYFTRAVESVLLQGRTVGHAGPGWDTSPLGARGARSPAMWRPSRRWPVMPGQ